MGSTRIPALRPYRWSAVGWTITDVSRLSSICRASALIAASVWVLTACGSTSTNDSSTPASNAGVATTAEGICAPVTASSTTTTTAGRIGSGSVPGGAGASGTATVTPAGILELDGGSATKDSETFTASAPNTSGVLVTNSGNLTLTDSIVNSSSDSSSTDESSFYGLDAGVLATSGSIVIMDGGSVTTTGVGANGVFATGSSTTVAVCSVTIDASGGAAHGVMASAGGALTARDLIVSTQGSNSAAVATDRGGGTITVQRGTYLTVGVDSPGLYSTGGLAVDHATVTATGSEAAVIEGSNSIVVTDSTLSGIKKSGVMVLQTASGDAQGSDGRFTMSGGSLTQAEGPLFFVTNATGTITLQGVNLTSGSGVLLKAAADQWGTTGSNGGHAAVNASNQTLSGDIVVDAVSDVSIALTDGSSLDSTVDPDHTGERVSISLDASSTWNVTGDSYLTVLDDAAGISDTTVTNVVGNGHTVHYDPAANSALGGKTYALSGGGTLTPS